MNRTNALAVRTLTRPVVRPARPRRSRQLPLDTLEPREQPESMLTDPTLGAGRAAGPAAAANQATATAPRGGKGATPAASPPATW